MKLNYILIVFLLFVLGSCSKDLGNYDYKEINTYTVSGINTGLGISRNYDVLMGQTLKVSPIIEGKFGDDKADLSYYWIVEGDTVSTDRDLDYFIELPIKVHQSKFVLVDNKTKMQYTTVFALNVTSPFGRGYFFLAEDEEHNTILSFKAVPDSETSIVSTDNLDDRKFGKYPQGMSGFQRFRTGANDYSWEVFILSKEGQYPVTYADLTRYAPLRYFTRDAFMGMWGTEYEFRPSYVGLRAAGVTYFINNGRIAFFDGSNLFRPSQLFDNTPDYKLDNILIGDLNRFHSNRALIGFDLISSRFKLISPYAVADPEKGIIYNRGLLDRIDDIPAPAGATDGHKVLGAASFYTSNTRVLSSKVITVKGSELNLISLDILYSANPPEFSLLNSQTVAGVNADSKIAIFEDLGGFAYVSAGNKIVRANFVDGHFSEYITLPTNLGKVTKMQYQVKSVNSTTPRLFVAMYDETSSKPNKGSILVYDINTKTIVHQFENVTGKVVDIFLGE